MTMLYSLLFLMLAAALILLALPFFKNSALKKQQYVFFSVFIFVLSLTLYYFSMDQRGLTHWFKEGRSHYQLQKDVANLGGIKGIIAQIERKLSANPRDAQGWFILGKLYASEQDYPSALTALKNAQDLDPSNKEISAYYDMIRKRFSDRG